MMGLWTMALPGMTPLTALLVGLVCDDLVLERDSDLPASPWS